MLEGLLQPMHILVILVVATLFFGPKKLPELGKGLASGIREFKGALKLGEDEPEKDAAATTSTPTTPTHHV